MNAAERTEVVTTEPLADQTTAIVQMIERAAMNPAVDIDKMERLLQMQERVMARNAEQSFNIALNEAQAALGPVAADAANPQTKSRYASYLALDKAVRPVYSSHGFSLSFNTDEGAPADHVRLVCDVRHRDGHKERYHVDMPADGKGAKGGDVMTKTHAAGSAFSYGQRYLLKLIFNIAVGDDDDGNRAGDNGQKVTPEQVDDLVALMEEVAADRTKFLNYLRIDTLAHLPANRFQDAVRLLEAKRKTPK